MATPAEKIFQQDLSHLDQTDIDELAQRYFALSDFEGFIQHPDNVPINVEKLRAHDVEKLTQHGQNIELCTGIGLSFRSERYISAGSYIKITIPTRLKEQIFIARVVLVRNHGNYFTIGVWFDHKQEANRARNVEQVCHLENYLREKRCQDGPFISQEIMAKQWVDTFSKVFPTI